MRILCKYNIFNIYTTRLIIINILKCRCIDIFNK